MTTLLQGDCLQLLKGIPDKSIDLIVTDPPYELPSRKGGGSQGHKVASVMRECEQLGIVNGFNENILNECMRVMRKPNMYIFCNTRQIPQYIDFFVNQHKCSFDILVWIKDNPVPTYSNKYLTDKEYILYFRKGGYCNPQNYESARSWFMCPLNQKDKGLYKHPTIKPLQIIERLVVNSSMGGGYGA
jgi:site-specific DNA-methyltransferase (adenine-specific)